MNNNFTYSEQDLVYGLKAFNNSAYEYLYNHYKGAIFSIILQIINDKETAEDVLQETFTLVWKNIDKYDASKGRLFTWLVNLARNAAINKTRSKIYKSSSKNDNLDIYVNNIDNSGSTSINVNAIGLRKQVHFLRDEYKNVIELTYYNGLTHEETAKVLNIPVGTVKTRLRNALIELRKHFV